MKKYLASFFLVLIACALPALAQSRQPNVLFIVADDLRPTYGDRSVHTPNLNRLAQRGVRFERAYVQYPVCNPSRVSFLTGLRPETTRVLDNTTYFRHPMPDIVTLPQLFKQQGYFTASLGKIFHRGGTMEDVNADWADPASWSHVKFYQSTPRGKEGEGRNLTNGALKWCQWLAAEGTDEDQPDGQVAAEAVRLLNEKRNEPFFLAVGFHKPHDPFIAPKKYFDLYPLDKIALHRDPAERSPEEQFAIPPGQFTQFKLFTDQERKEFKRAYLAGVSFMDAQLGKVLDALEQNKLWDNTIIVFIGDHGYHLGERGWWNKNTLFELSARAPMLIATPKMKGGKASSALVEFVDLYPTLVELAGLTAPHKLAGVSLKPLLNNPASKGKDAAFTVVTRGKTIGRSVRTARWRYTEWDNGTRGVELYDHQNDAGEYRNLAREAKHAATVAELKKLLQRSE